MQVLAVTMATGMRTVKRVKVKNNLHQVPHMRETLGPIKKKATERKNTQTVMYSLASSVTIRRCKVK